MHVLVIGSGGREHALVWKLSQSGRVKRISVAPGNGGTADIAENVDIQANDISNLVEFARREHVDLAIVGPEAPLVAGLVDTFAASGIPAFGPTAAAAQLEGSKAFAKRFMLQEGIPTPAAQVFTDYQEAVIYLERQEAPLVVKASGLAAGKGVFICATQEEARKALHSVMVECVFGVAGEEVLIEECVTGEEVSILAFSDGRTVVPMIPARDYKRVGDGDLGPNTGGMGCYAPSPYLDEGKVSEIVSRILQPAIDGMQRRGEPYVGVLYAGLMITPRGLTVLEFNCRFGDPETQVILPLLESDLVDVLFSCLDGTLGSQEIRWSTDAAACVVMASKGYPGSYEKGKLITGVEQAEALPDVTVIQAGTRRSEKGLETAGGRVLVVMAKAKNLDLALNQAYAGVERIRFDGAQYRKDIGAQGGVNASAYAESGVDIHAGERAVDLMRAAVQSTYTPAVLAGVGSFGGLYSLEGLEHVKSPVLVASTDGVGTKTLIAAATGRFASVGEDIVNHCVNDILVQGARPLFFMDYIAAGKLDPEQVAAVVTGCAKACREVGCTLLGGETAEMPGVYQPGTFDLVGTMVGWVDKSVIIDGSQVGAGDVCIGLYSSGLHTNGFSLARHIFRDCAWDTVLPELGRPLDEILLEPHRAFLSQVETLWSAGIEIKAMAHITGGGFTGNIPRVLPEGTGVRIDRTTWQVPAIFQVMQSMGRVEMEEMYRVFNMGIGMVLMLSPDAVEPALAALSGEASVIGMVEPWDGKGPRVQI